MSSQVQRLGIATVCVCALLALPAFTSARLQNGTIQPVLDQSSYQNELLEQNVLDAHVVEDLFGCLANTYPVTGLPQGFMFECFDPSRWGAYRCYASEGLVGIQWSSSMKDASQTLCDALKESGWERVGTSDEGYSFIKSAGIYQWMNLQIFESRAYTSAVLHYRKE